MTEYEKSALNETEQRSKLNEIQLSEIKADIKDIKEENKITHKIAMSVEIMAVEIKNMVGQMTDVKADVNNIGSKVDSMKTEIEEVKNQDHKQKAKRWDDIKDKIVWVFVGGIAIFIFERLINVVFAQ